MTEIFANWTHWLGSSDYYQVKETRLNGCLLPCYYSAWLGVRRRTTGSRMLNSQGGAAAHHVRVVSDEYLGQPTSFVDGE